MAILVNEEKIKENDKQGSHSDEKFHVPSGNHVVNLASYVELGRHVKMFNGKPAVAESGKNKGQLRPPEMFVSMTFEFSGAERTGEYPHTYETSIIMQDGGFMHSLSVSDDFINNRLSLQFANKTGYKKYLDAINMHCNKKFQGLHQAVGTAIHVQAKTVAHYKDANGKDVKCLDTEVPGYDPENPHVNVEGVRYYTYIKPESIQPMVIMLGKTKVDMSEYIVPIIGDYAPVFDWDAPTKEAWAKLKPWQKRAISKALDLDTSAFGTMLKVDEELAKEIETLKAGKKEAAPEKPDMPETHSAPGVPPAMVPPSSEDDLPI